VIKRRVVNLGLGQYLTLLHSRSIKLIFFDQGIHVALAVSGIIRTCGFGFNPGLSWPSLKKNLHLYFPSSIGPVLD
jgi:hypothetical protein